MSAPHPQIAPASTAAAASIDDHLGPRTGRFFGDGFRRVEHEVGALEIAPRRIEATARLGYPGDWSRKRSGALRPHLSSVDALLLAVALVEAYLTDRHRLGVRQRQALWLRSVDIRSGRIPQEDLEYVALRAELTRSLASGARGISVFDCAIGGLAVRCEVEHPAGTPTAAGRAAYDGLAELLGPASGRYYGDGYKRLPQHITDVQVAADARRVEAAVTVPAGRPDRGLGGGHPPGPSMIDGLVCLAQLAQVLAYRLDGIEREHSNTLWMRRLTEVAARPARPVTGLLAAGVSLNRSRLVELNGTRWRTLDVSGRLGPIAATAAIAHQLPSEG